VVRSVERLVGLLLVLIFSLEGLGPVRVALLRPHSAILALG
jgi:hypothetical protein